MGQHYLRNACSIMLRLMASNDLGSEQVLTCDPCSFVTLYIVRYTKITGKRKKHRASPGCLETVSNACSVYSCNSLLFVLGYEGQL